MVGDREVGSQPTQVAFQADLQIGNLLDLPPSAIGDMLANPQNA
jgi:hypothetical protein